MVKGCIAHLCLNKPVYGLSVKSTSAATSADRSASTSTYRQRHVYNAADVLPTTNN